MNRFKIIALGLAMSLITGCAASETAIRDDANIGEEQEIDYSISVVSQIEADSCCICGDNERSLMAYYRKSGMIGIVCLNTMYISSLDTRMYSDDGTRIIDSGSMSFTYTGHGEGECSFHMSGMPDRGIFEGQVNYGDNSVPDFEKIRGFLCQTCLDKVVEMYEEEMRWSDGKGRFPEVCLVDFATNELYTLGEHHVGYWIRDFWIVIDHNEDSSDIMAIYAPENAMDDYQY